MSLNNAVRFRRRSWCPRIEIKTDGLVAGRRNASDVTSREPKRLLTYETGPTEEDKANGRNRIDRRVNGLGHGLRRAPSRVCARLPNTNRLSDPATTRTTNSVPATAGNSFAPFQQLASGATFTIRRQRAICPTGTAAGYNRRRSGSAADTSRSCASGSRPGLLLGAGLLVLGQSGLDMDRRQLDDSALARCDLGAWRLVQTQGRVGLAWRTLAVSIMGNQIEADKELDRIATAGGRQMMTD